MSRKFQSEAAHSTAASAGVPGTPPSRLPPTNNCVFTSRELHEVCESIKRGSVPALSAYIEWILSQRSCRIGPKTFCPGEDSPSAFVVATQNGRLEILKYLLSCQPKDFNVNHFATTSFYHRGQCHICSSLYAACRCGYLDAAKELIAAGAAVDLPCKCCGETPLRAAAACGFLDVVKLLLSHGANPKKADKKVKWTPLFAAAANGQATTAVHHKKGRWTPLFAAAANGQATTANHHAAVVRELLRSGADGYQPVQSGHYVTHWYSAIQVAAVSGNEAMIDAFIGQGYSPVKSLSSHSQHTPNPLFMAAALGYRDIVAVLLTHPDCSPDVRLDTIKILGPPWLDSVPGLESSITSFGLASADSLNIMNVYAVTQSLQEYIGGYGSRGLLDHLIERGKSAFENRRYSDTEIFWIRAMVLASIYKSEKCSTRALLHRLEFNRHVCSALDDMTADNYTPLFDRYVDFLLSILSWSDIHHDRYMVLDTALLLMAVWLHHDVVLQTRHSRSEYDSYIGSDECERYGQKMVHKYLHPFDSESSILWYAMALVQRSRNSLYRPRTQIRALCADQSMFFDALLRWGADAVINEPKDGKRPLHVLATTKPGLIPMFLAHGAHIDAVDRAGETPYEQKAVLPAVKAQLAHTGPLPLVCLACRAIVHHKISYRTTTSVPPHMINVIKLHDHLAFTPTTS